MSLLACVTERLEQAQSVSDELPESKSADPYLLWLERQLANIISHLLALAADLEAGCSISDFGVFTDDECREMMQDLGVEIANLKSMIRTIKMLGK